MAKTKENVRLVVSRDELMAACDAITPIISRKTPYEVIRNLHLSVVAEEQPVLRGTNMDMEIVVDLKDSEPQESSWSALLPAERFTQFVRACKYDEYLEIRIGKDQIEAKGIKNQITLQTADPRMFPKSKDFTSEDQWQIKASDFGTLLKRTAYAIDEVSTKMNLGGVCIDFVDEAMHGVATDTARMPHMVIPATKVGNPKFKLRDVILPLSMVRHASTLCMKADDDSMVSLSLSENGQQIIAKFDGIEVISKLVNGPFPNWEFLDSKPYRDVAKVKVINFREAVSAVQITTAEKSQGVRILFEGDKMNLVTSSETGRSKAECDMESLGDPLDVILSGTYLLQCLATLPGEEVITVTQSEELAKTVRFSLEDGFRHNLGPMSNDKQPVSKDKT